MSQFNVNWFTVGLSLHGKDYIDLGDKNCFFTNKAQTMLTNITLAIIWGYNSSKCCFKEQYYALIKTRISMARSLIWWKPTTIHFLNVSYYFIILRFDLIFRILSYNERPNEPMFASLWSFPINIERSISVWMPGTMFMCSGLHWQEGLNFKQGLLNFQNLKI